jgi:hypothetical protein
MRKGVNYEAGRFYSKHKLPTNGTAGCIMDFWNSIVAWVGMGLGLLLSSVGMDSGG